MSVLEFQEIDTDPTPDDEPPPLDAGHAPFDERYPDSTPEAPYGYKANGEPYTRHHGKRGGTSSAANRSTSSKANEALASSAARMLCQVNSLVGISLSVFGMPNTAEDLEKANVQFETMARESLRTDPALCRKILSAGATSGRTGLIVAYVYLAGSAFPAAREEFQAKKALKEVEYDDPEA